MFHAIILGITEGLTEFLPVSSTGHLILVGELLNLETTEFLKSFDIAIQLGAILAVVVLFWRSFLEIEVLKRLAVAFIPTGIVGFFAYPFIKDALLGNPLLVVLSLGLGGVALIFFEFWHTENPEESKIAAISYKHATIVGVFQSIAIVPGISRSGATILGGLFLGIPRTTIVEFSFLLAVPTMLAATGYDMLKSAFLFTTADFSLLSVGFVASFVTALIAIRFLLRFVRAHSFTPFGVYRIAVALLFFFVVL